MFPGMLIGEAGDSVDQIPLTLPNQHQPIISHRQGDMYMLGACLEVPSDTGDRQSVIVCKMCHASFTTMSSLRRHHNSVHMQVKMFECNACGKRFTQKENYTDHTNSHRNIKAHKCNFCGAAYTYRSMLRHHIIKQHGENEDAMQVATT